MTLIIIGKIKSKILTSLGATQTNGKIKSVVLVRSAGKTWKRSVERETNAGLWKVACPRKSQNEITAADWVPLVRWQIQIGNRWAGAGGTSMRIAGTGRARSPPVCKDCAAGSWKKNRWKSKSEATVAVKSYCLGGAAALAD